MCIRDRSTTTSPARRRRGAGPCCWTRCARSCLLYTSRLTCSLQEAADLTGLSYDYLHGQSKIANPSERLPGFKTGKSVYRVIVSELPGWLLRKAGIA